MKTRTAKYISVIIGLATIGSFAFAMAASAAMAAGPQGRHFGNGTGGGQRPAVVGQVLTNDGTTITVSSLVKENETASENQNESPNSATATTTYTITTSVSTQVTKAGVASTVGSVAVGDTVAVQGTVSGTSVTATSIRDGLMIGGQGRNGFGINGTVTTVNPLTVTTKAMPNGGTAATYTVDTSSATVMKGGATSSVSAIAVGDTVMIQGTVTGTNVVAKTIRDGVGQQPQMQGNGQPVVGGKITAITGNSVTITNSSNVTYSVDATSAKITVGGQTSTVAGLAVNDNVIVQGTVNGNSVTASSIIDQKASPAQNGTTNNGNGKSKGFMGGMFDGIGNFFKHMFGF